MNHAEISFFTADSIMYGENYGNWTVKWWHWFLSIPKAMNPVVDRTGEFAYINQPIKDVWFLAGKLADEERTFPNRFCRIPVGRSILFPVINCEANPLEYPELHTPEDLVERVTRDEDTIKIKECSVNGKIIPAQRVKSDPLVFKVNMPEDNALDVRSGSVYASADGYWVFLKPLPIGEYMISFHGTCELGKLNSGANYRIQVYDQVDI